MDRAGHGAGDDDFAAHGFAFLLWVDRQFWQVPAFRSSCSVGALTFTNFGKSWATHKLIGSSTALSI
jgi:hypothetical protein